jgi:hypothetical protein
MKKLLLFGIALSVFVNSKAVAQCELNCDPGFLKAHKALNDLWDNLSPENKKAYEPSQTKWEKYRNAKCGKIAKCLEEETWTRVKQIWEVETYGEEPTDLRMNQDEKDCLSGGGGLACFTR